MSGIVGMVSLDGQPIDGSWLHSATEYMAYRGPDAQEVWIEGPVGFAHAALRTHAASAHEKQPRSLEGHVWITADARIDGQRDLRTALAGRGRSLSHETTDAELILHAYHVWGTACLEHLIGDFVFAIWDTAKRRLFCARDHFGVKLFYYAQKGNLLLFSNTLNVLRTHPAISDTLNEAAIGDFLLFKFNQEVGTTFFTDIRKVPPAHSLSWSGGKIRCQRYWRLPADQRIQYTHRATYVDHFREVLTEAVHDRMRADQIGLFMSGGMDSGALAATAQQIRASASASIAVKAYTVVYDRMMPDKERHYATLVADSLDLPLHVTVADDHDLYQGWNQLEPFWPEPVHEPLRSIKIEIYKRLHSEGTRVLLSGLGVMDCFGAPRAYFINLLKRLRLLRLGVEVGKYISHFGHLPRVGFRSTLKGWLTGDASVAGPAYPDWLDEAFEKQFGLRERWDHIRMGRMRGAVHPLHPEAFKNIQAPWWPFWFEVDDPGVIGFPVEMRYPLMDLRIINFLFSIPPIPWSKNKLLLRSVMQDRLPTEVVSRPKSPLVGDPIYLRLKEYRKNEVKQIKYVPELERYIDCDKNSLILSEGEQNIAKLHTLSLNYWMKQLRGGAAFDNRLP